MTKFFKPVVKATQAAGYAAATVAIGTVAVAGAATKLTVENVNTLLRGVEKSVSRGSNYLISGTEFFAKKTTHKINRAIGNDGHEDKSEKAFNHYNNLYKR